MSKCSEFNGNAFFAIHYIHINKKTNFCHYICSQFGKSYRKIERLRKLQQITEVGRLLQQKWEDCCILIFDCETFCDKMHVVKVKTPKKTGQVN